MYRGGHGVLNCTQTLCNPAATDVYVSCIVECFFFQAEDGIRDVAVTGVQTCALPILYGITLTFQHRGGRSNVSRRAAFPGQLRLCRAQPTATAQRRDKPSAPRQTEMLDRDRKSVV